MYCNHCGKELTNNNYHLVVANNGKILVPVCRDQMTCQRPYRKESRKDAM